MEWVALANANQKVPIHDIVQVFPNVTDLIQNTLFEKDSLLKDVIGKMNQFP